MFDTLKALKKLPGLMQDLTRAVATLLQRIGTMAINIDDIKAKLEASIAQATANTDALASVQTLLQGLRETVTSLDARVAELQAAIDADEDVSTEDLQALRDGLDALGTKLAEQTTATGVLLNTPSA